MPYPYSGYSMLCAWHSTIVPSMLQFFFSLGAATLPSMLLRMGSCHNFLFFLNKGKPTSVLCFGLVCSPGGKILEDQSRGRGKVPPSWLVHPRLINKDVPPHFIHQKPIFHRVKITSRPMLYLQYKSFSCLRGNILLVTPSSSNKGVTYNNLPPNTTKF